MPVCACMYDHLLKPLRSFVFERHWFYFPNSHQLPGTSSLVVQLHEPLFHPCRNSPSLSLCRSYAYSHSCHELSHTVVLVFLADTAAISQNQPLLLALTILRLPLMKTLELLGAESDIVLSMEHPTVSYSLHVLL